MKIESEQQVTLPVLPLRDVVVYPHMVIPLFVGIKKSINCLEAAMEQGKFPYAHVDLQITDNEKYFLSEIALNGGIKGARISRKELDQKKQNLLENLAAISLTVP